MRKKRLRTKKQILENAQPRDNLEFVIQCDIVKKLRMRDWLVFHVDNGNIKSMGRLKKMGLQKGMPDIVALKVGKIVFLEIKTPNGIISKEQLLIHERLAKEMFEVRVVRGIEGIEDLLL